VYWQAAKCSDLPSFGSAAGDSVWGFASTAQVHRLNVAIGGLKVSKC
jgi:hypothetical protein